MATDRTAGVAVPAAAVLLLWPAVWNGYPIVFADSGTYLSQAIDRYAGWDRPVFYSLFMLPLHLTVTVWPVIVVQALLAAWLLWVVCRVLVVGLSPGLFVGGVFVLSACTWLPWLVCELMPDLFTPLLVLVLCLLAWVPGLVSRGEQIVLAGLATLMIASQQSSLPLACVILAVLAVVRRCVPVGGSRAPEGGLPRRGLPREGLLRISWAAHVSWPGLARPSMPCNAVIGELVDGRPKTGHNAFTGSHLSLRPAWARTCLLIVLPPALAVVGLCTANLAAHGRFAVSPFGNIFLLARVIYDGPGMAALRRDCPAAHWRLCPFVDGFPPQSDDFLWTHDSPLNRAGGPKIVSQEAGAIIGAALRADPIGEAGAALANTLEQMTLFASGDGLNPWPAQVSPVIAQDFPAREQAAYEAARQQAGTLSVPWPLARLHLVVALAGVVACVLLLPVALYRGDGCSGLLLAVLLAVPVSAAITGALSGPHDRYQARIMWLPPFVALVSGAALGRRRA